MRYGDEMSSLPKHLRASAWYDQFDVCNRAEELLKLAGFEPIGASHKSEACYYRLPGREASIRVAAHRKAKPHQLMRNAAPVLATITISAEMRMYQGGILCVPDHKIVAIVASAIGQYMLRLGGMRQDEYGAVVVQGDTGELKPRLSSGSSPDGRTIASKTCNRAAE